MIYLLACMGLLVAGYFSYGWLVDRIFQPDSGLVVPAAEKADGVDFVEMPTWKVFFIQLLNIAGVGPIFGPILGALYGPVALLWIVAGTILAGGVHDYFSGMLSMRHHGASMPEVVGDYMGAPARYGMRFFSVLLLLLVGVVFVLAPAGLLYDMTGLDRTWLVVVIFAYYFLATVLPIDKLIGRLYPVFGSLLLFMTLGVLYGLFRSDFPVLPNLDVTVNTHPEGLPIWPLLFITLSCGAISGFHSTQSPIMARCLRTSKHGRLVFYGAMVAEGGIALIWAAAALSFYKTPAELNAVIQAGTPSLVVERVCRGLLGPVGGGLAILGVIILPITSGDTAFRATRLILAETFHVDQKKIATRLLIAAPLLLVAYAISMIDFSIVWRYFGWSNQVLAMLMLWSAAIYLARARRCFWIAALPATFMTAVTVAFILQSKIGFRLPVQPSNIAGMLAAILLLAAFLYVRRIRRLFLINKPEGE